MNKKPHSSVDDKGDTPSAEQSETSTLDSSGKAAISSGSSKSASTARSRKLVMKTGRIWLLSLAHLSAGLITFFLALVAAAAMVLGSEEGRLWLVKTLLPTLLVDTEYELQLEEPASPGLGRWQFSKLVFLKDGQPLVVAESLEFDLRWRALFYSRIDIAEFSSGRLQITLPESSGSDVTAGDDQAISYHLDTTAFPAARIQHLQLGELVLNLPGTEIPPLTAEGKLSALWGNQWLDTDLNISTLSSQPATLSLQGEFNSSSSGHVAVTLYEAAGGWIGKQLGLPDKQVLDMSLAMTAARSNQQLDIDLEHLRLPWQANVLESQGTLSLDLDSREAELHQLELSVNGHPQIIRGTLAESFADLTLDLHDFPLQVIDQWVPGLNGGQLSGNLQVNGPWSALTGEGKVSGQSQYQGYPLSVEVAARGSQERIDISAGTVRLGEMLVETDGGVDIAGGSLDLNIRRLQGALSYLTLLDVELTPDLQLSVDAKDGAVYGPWDDPVYSGNLNAQGSFRQRPLVLEGGFKGDIRQVRLINAHLDSLESQVDADGVIDWNQGRLNLQAKASRVPLELLAWLDIEFPPELSAETSAEGQIKGPFNAVEFIGHGKVAGTWEQAGFDLSSQLAASASRVKFDGLEASLDLNGLDGVQNIPVARLSSTGYFDIGSQFIDAKTSIRELRFEALKLAHVEYPEDLSGILNSDFNLKGGLPIPKITGSLQSTGILAGEPFTLNVGGAGNEQRVDFSESRLHWQDSDLLLNGYLAPDSFDLEVALNNFNTSSLHHFGVDLHPAMFNLQASLKGTPEHPRLEGTMRANTLYQLEPDIHNAAPAEFQWDLDFKLDDETLELQNLIQENQKSQGQLALTTAWRPYLNRWMESPDTLIRKDLPLDFHARGNFDLAWLNQLIDEDIQTVRGQVNIDLDTQGILSRPLLNGQLTVAKGYYENNITQTTVDAISMDVEFRGNELEIVKGEATDGLDGTLNTSGKVRWNDDKDGMVDLNVVAKNVSLLRREDMEGAVSGVLEARGSLKQILLSGNIDVSPFQLLLDKISNADIPELEVSIREDVQEEGLQSEIPLPLLDLNITLDLSGQSYIRGRGLDAELEGKVIIIGPSLTPEYKGQFNVVRGTFELFGRRFNLTSGDVIFANDNIALYIEGHYTGSELEYIATLSGTLEDLDISLRTVPDLPEDEALSRLLFGKSVKNISPLQAARLASAIQTLRGEGGFDPIAETRDALGVDTLTVDSQQTKEGNGLSVGVGKYVTEKVYVELERTPEPSQPWKGSIEIELTPSLNLETTTGTRTGFGGVELLWKHDY